MEVEHFLLSKIALQVLSDADRAYSHRCTRKQQITDFQGHEAADISNDFIYPEQHVRCMTALHLLIINRWLPNCRNLCRVPTDYRLHGTYVAGHAQ